MPQHHRPATDPCPQHPGQARPCFDPSHVGPPWNRSDADRWDETQRQEVADRRAAYGRCGIGATYQDCNLVRERFAADHRTGSIADCPVHGRYHDLPALDGGRAVYVLHEGGDTPFWDLCGPCIAATSDPDQALGDILRRDDSLHCVGCDFHRGHNPDACYIASWNDRDEAETMGDGWSRALKNATAWRVDRARSWRTPLTVYGTAYAVDGLAWRAHDLGLAPIFTADAGTMYARSHAENADRWAATLATHHLRQRAGGWGSRAR